MRHFILDGEIHTLEKSLDCVNAVKKQDIDTLIEKYIAEDKFSLLAFGTRNLQKRKVLELSF